MAVELSTSASALLFTGGPSLVDLAVDATELRITVTGPRMLFERLDFVTTLSAFDGCTVPRLRDFAGCLEGSIHCGLIGIQSAPISVTSMRAGGVLQIELGPPTRREVEPGAHDLAEKRIAGLRGGRAMDADEREHRSDSTSGTGQESHHRCPPRE